MGTLAYMAPAQIEKRAKDTGTDIFGFGLVCTNGNGLAGLSGQRSREPQPIHPQRCSWPVSHYAPQIPPAFDFLLARCLAKDPPGRSQSICEVL